MGALTKAVGGEIIATDPIKNFLEPIRKRALVAAAKHIDKDAFYIAMYEAMKRTPKLANCDRESVYAALMSCAKLGLEPWGHPPGAYILPYGNKAQLIVDYRGMMALAMRDPSVAAIYGGTVHASDVLTISMGDGATFRHEPARRDRGPVEGYYAYMSYHDDRRSRYVYITVEEIEQHRDKYVKGKSGPWFDNFEAMAQKTCIKRMLTRMPLDPAAQKDVHLANKLDGQTVTLDHGEIVSVESHHEEAQAKMLAAAKEEPSPETDNREGVLDRIEKLYQSAKARNIKGLSGVLESLDDLNNMSVPELKEVADALWNLGSEQ